MNVPAERSDTRVGRNGLPRRRTVSRSRINVSKLLSGTEAGIATRTDSDRNERQRECDGGTFLESHETRPGDEGVKIEVREREAMAGRQTSTMAAGQKRVRRKRSAKTSRQPNSDAYMGRQRRRQNLPTANDGQQMEEEADIEVDNGVESQAA